MSGFVDAALRVALTAIQKLRKGWWFVRRPRTFGAHAVALTAAGNVVLVKLRYASGWRVPGGGRPADEPPVEAALRELREEIGMTAHGEARLARDFAEATDCKRDSASLVIVRDVEFRPRRWSWEVESVREFDLDALGDDISGQTRRWLAEVRSLL